MLLFIHLFIMIGKNMQHMQRFIHNPRVNDISNPVNSADSCVPKQQKHSLPASRLALGLLSPDTGDRSALFFFTSKKRALMSL